MPWSRRLILWYEALGSILVREERHYMLPHGSASLAAMVTNSASDPARILSHHVPAMDLHGDFAGSQLSGDLLVEHAGNDEGHDLALA